MTPRQSQARLSNLTLLTPVAFSVSLIEWQDICVAFPPPQKTILCLFRNIYSSVELHSWYYYLYFLDEELHVAGGI